MAEPKGKRDFRDRDRINVKERHEIAFWAKRWGVSPEQVVAAHRKVGQYVKDIATELGKRR
ncbi:MAG TPA: DUF3606 domain-containing protein [Caulobacteraceae bacterium]|jgi:hypothetical protein|nr:DUF3606 domain-containing protein [Caulobacteraceae bacterium]